MGGLKKAMPTTHATFLIGCLAIAGMPPFSGFFSKDEILAAAFESNPVFWGLGVLGALMTAFYMFRLYAMTFQGSFRGTDEQQHHLHESPAAITIPLIILAILAFGGGLIGIPEVFVHGGHRLEAFLAPVFEPSVAIKSLQHQTHEAMSHSQEYLLMAVSVGGALIALVFAWSKFAKYQRNMEEPTGFAKVLANKWYVDELYDAVIVKPLNNFAKFLNNVVEKNIIDGFVNGVGRAVNYSGRQIRFLQSGQVGAYILLMVLGILILFIIQFLSK
jgi:NADH-quinone oxidoreductase subunit L